MRVPGVRFVQGKNKYTDQDGRKYAIAIHNTSNTASDEGEADWATRRPDGTSAHFYVDGDSVTQSLDTDHRSGHAGSEQANEGAVSVEITGLNAWTRQQWLDRVDWAELGRVLAAVCRHHDIPVRRLSIAEMRAGGARARGFYTHDQARAAWGGTDHTDPGPNFPMDHLIREVADRLDGGDDDMLDKAHDTPIIQSAVHGTKIGASGLTLGIAVDRAANNSGEALRKLDAVLAAVLADGDADRVIARLNEIEAGSVLRDQQLWELVEQLKAGDLTNEGIARELVRILGGEAAPAA